MGWYSDLRTEYGYLNYKDEEQILSLYPTIETFKDKVISFTGCWDPVKVGSYCPPLERLAFFGAIYSFSMAYIPGTVSIVSKYSGIFFKLAPLAREVWFCNNPCYNRENDKGYPCYWCGGKE